MADKDKTAKFEIIDQSDIKKVANELVNVPLEEQKLAINNIYAQSAMNAVKVSVELIQMIKKTNDETMKSNKQFMALCDKGIETLNKTIEDGQISEEEKKDVRNKIFEILKMANDSNTKAVAITKEESDKAFKTGAAVVGGTIGAIVLLRIIADRIAKSSKK